MFLLGMPSFPYIRSAHYFFVSFFPGETGILEKKKKRWGLPLLLSCELEIEIWGTELKGFTLDLLKLIIGV